MAEMFFSTYPFGEGCLQLKDCSPFLIEAFQCSMCRLVAASSDGLLPEPKIGYAHLRYGRMKHLPSMAQRSKYVIWMASPSPVLANSAVVERQSGGDHS